jgi:hypothetical protein
MIITGSPISTVRESSVEEKLFLLLNASATGHLNKIIIKFFILKCWLNYKSQSQSQHNNNNNNNNNRTCLSIDVATPSDRSVIQKEVVNKLNIKSLSIEIQ